jgi:hypothetical protein
VNFVKYLDSNSKYQLVIQLLNHDKLLDDFPIAYDYDSLSYIVMVSWDMTSCRLEGGY